MKIEEAIYHALKKLPTLYKHPTYEESKRDVLHHYFIILGTGVTWAQTKRPEDGGYLTVPTYYKTKTDENGYAIRKDDKPYDKSGIVIDEAYLNKFFSQNLYYVWGKDKDGLSNLDKKHRQFDVVWEDEKHLIDEAEWILHPVRSLYVSEVYNWEPYPNFRKDYSCFWENKWNKNQWRYIQEDWRLAAIEHLQLCKDWFEDDNKFWNARYQPQAKDLKQRHSRIGVKDLLWYDKTFNWRGDFKLLAKLMHEKYRKESLEFINETLIRLETLQRP